MTEHSTNPILTPNELSHKMHMLNGSYTQEERLEDTLVDVLGFLVATRDGHEYRYDIGGAIAKIAKIIEPIKKFKEIA